MPPEHITREHVKYQHPIKQILDGFGYSPRTLSVKDGEFIARQKERNLPSHPLDLSGKGIIEKDTTLKQIVIKVSRSLLVFSTLVYQDDTFVAAFTETDKRMLLDLAAEQEISRLSHWRRMKERVEAYRGNLPLWDYYLPEPQIELLPHMQEQLRARVP